MTYQEIVNRRRDLLAQRTAAGEKAAEQFSPQIRPAMDAATAPFTKELESLEELCGGIGHIFVDGTRFLVVPGAATRYCTICGYKPCSPNA